MPRASSLPSFLLRSSPTDPPTRTHNNHIPKTKKELFCAFSVTHRSCPCTARRPGAASSGRRPPPACSPGPARGGSCTPSPVVYRGSCSCFFCGVGVSGVVNSFTCLPGSCSINQPIHTQSINQSPPPLTHTQSSPTPTCSPRILKLTELGGVVVCTRLSCEPGTRARHDSCPGGRGRTRRMTWGCVV